MQAVFYLPSAGDGVEHHARYVFHRHEVAEFVSHPVGEADYVAFEYFIALRVVKSCVLSDAVGVYNRCRLKT